MSESEIIMKRFSHQHLAMAFELSGHCYANGVHHRPEIKDAIDRVKEAGELFKAYIETGKVPQWMIDNPMPQDATVY